MIQEQRKLESFSAAFGQGLPSPALHKTRQGREFLDWCAGASGQHKAASLLHKSCAWHSELGGITCCGTVQLLIQNMAAVSLAFLAGKVAASLEAEISFGRREEGQG